MISTILEKNIWRLCKQLAYPFILFFAFAGYFPTIANATSLAPELHKRVSVTGNLVTLADLFKNTGIRGNTPLFRSPNPGTTGKISVRRILAAAKKHGVSTHTLPDFGMVSISRTSRVIERSDLEDLIRGRMEDDRPTMDAKSQLVIKLPGDFQNIHLDSALQGDLRLASFKWSQRSERFKARFSLLGTDPITVKGTASLMIEVTVAKTTIAKGKLLTRGDTELRLVKSSTLRSKQPLNIEDMLGLSAKRSLRAGKPISIGDLEAPMLIRKNQLVTILLDVPGLIIRSQGKALADAKKGGAVKVLNIQSKRIIHATARASGLVAVSLTQSFRSGS